VITNTTKELGNTPLMKVYMAGFYSAASTRKPYFSGLKKGVNFS
jgi:hypothetical protein